MVNEHLDVESHWWRRLLFVSDGNTTEIEGKESDGRGGTGRADWETYWTRRGNEKKEGKEVGQKGQLMMVENRGKMLTLTLYFEISHTVCLVSVLPPVCLACIRLVSYTAWKNWRGSFVSWHCLYWYISRGLRFLSCGRLRNCKSQ